MTLSELFAQYDIKDTEWEKKKLELEEAARERSEVVKQIALAIAPKKKISRQGRELTIVIRGSTYFFRGNTKPSDIIEVE